MSPSPFTSTLTLTWSLTLTLTTPGLADAPPDPARLLWGEAAPRLRVQRTCEEAARLLDRLPVPPRDLRELAAELRQATGPQGDPLRGEAWAALGRTLLELHLVAPGEARLADAGAALQRAVALGFSDSGAQAAQALIAALTGDPGRALVTYQRLARDGGMLGPGAPLLLRRTGDALMALGRPAEALPPYRLACDPPRRPPWGAARSFVTGRACYALAVALDRGGDFHGAGQAGASAYRLDPAQITLAPADFVPAADQAYTRALALIYGGRNGAPADRAPACAALPLLRDYLQRADPAAVPLAYLQRARDHLERLAAPCQNEYSAPKDPTRPLGSPTDRDGGATWKAGTGAAPKSPT